LEMIDVVISLAQPRPPQDVLFTSEWSD